MKSLTPETEKLLRRVDIRDDEYIQITLNKNCDKFLAHVYRQLETTIAPPYSIDAAFFCKRIPSSRQVWKKDSVSKIFELPITDNTVEILTTAWPTSQLKWIGAAKELFKVIKLSTFKGDLAAKRTAEFKTLQKVPDTNGLAVNPQLPLADYQKVAALNSVYSDGYALLMEQGTGKTPTAIARICTDAKKCANRMYRVLIVAPNNVRQNWKNELQSFSTVPFKATILRGNLTERTAGLISAFNSSNGAEYTAVIIGYRTLVNTWEILKNIEWDLAILDESHNIAAHNTQQTKTALELRDHSAKRMILTGTSLRNSLFDLYTQLEFLGKGYSGFDSFKGFKDFHAEYENNAFSSGGPKTIKDYKNIPLLQERLSRYAFIISKKEALKDLPEKTYDIIECSLQPKQAAIYKSVATDLIARIEDQLDRTQNKELVVKNILVQLLRLAQITSGYIQWDGECDEDGNVIREGTLEHFAPNPKEDTIVELCKEKSPEQKSLVWGCFTENITSLKDRLDAEFGEQYAVTYYGQTNDKQRIENEHRFNCDPECKMLIGHARAGGTGLNLLGFDPKKPDDYETYCDHVMFYSMNWSSIDWRQAADRAHRRGTKNNVRISSLIVPGSIDEEIYERVKMKARTNLKLHDMKELLHAIASAHVQVNGD